MEDKKSISTAILNRIRQEYKTQKITQGELAKKYGISQQYLCYLLLGKQSPSGLTVAKLESMFPDATLTFGDEVHYREVTVDNVPAYKHKLMERIIQLEMPDDVRTAVLRAILDTEA